MEISPPLLKSEKFLMYNSRLLGSTRIYGQCFLIRWKKRRKRRKRKASLSPQEGDWCGQSKTSKTIVHSSYWLVFPTRHESKGKKVESLIPTVESRLHVEVEYFYLEAFLCMLLWKRLSVCTPPRSNKNTNVQWAGNGGVCMCSVHCGNLFAFWYAIWSFTIEIIEGGKLCMI